MSAEPDLQRLAGAVRTRRQQLYSSRQSAADEAGMSKDTWKRVEDGLPVREMTYVGMEPALRWAQGSCRRILAGGEPVTVESVPGAPDAVVSSVDPQEIADVVQLAAIATTRGLTADEIRELSKRVVDDLRERGII